MLLLGNLVHGQKQNEKYAASLKFELQNSKNDSSKIKILNKKPMPINTVIHNKD